jgi:hypothetical protein
VPSATFVNLHNHSVDILLATSQSVPLFNHLSITFSHMRLTSVACHSIFNWDSLSYVPNRPLLLNIKKYTGYLSHPFPGGSTLSHSHHRPSVPVLNQLLIPMWVSLVHLQPMPILRRTICFPVITSGGSHVENNQQRE